jgi:FdhD protein
MAGGSTLRREPSTLETFHRLTKKGAIVPETGHLAVEDFLTIDIENIGAYTLMCTPAETEALAVGFLFSEGIIQSMDDIDRVSVCEEDPGVVRVQLVHTGETHVPGRNLLVVSACGACGSRVDRGKILTGIESAGKTLCLSLRDLLDGNKILRDTQSVFDKTGGTHAAAILSSAGERISTAEDIGRHNALDKAIGKCLSGDVTTAGCWAMLSGRVSFDLVIKAARAGIELIAAVSAPSSLAVETAWKCNITLCAFVRGDRATVYTHPDRLSELRK